MRPCLMPMGSEKNNKPDRYRSDEGVEPYYY